MFRRKIATVPSLSNSLDRLCEQGWLEVDGKYRYSLHRLLRDVLLFKMKPEVEDVMGFVEHITELIDDQVAVRLNNLAWVWRSQEQWERSLPLFERAHEIWKNALGEEHLHTKSAAESIAYMRGRLGEGEK
ncbi:MAG: tetratricopeptide repeat protein [Bacteroidota bacterium]